MLNGNSLESQDRRRALNRGDSSNPFVDGLEALGVDSVYGFEAKPELRGLVMVGPGFYFGREWGGAAIDRWLDGFLASGTGVRKLKKPRRAAHAAERHLVIVIRSISQAGMGIPLGLTDRDEPGATPYVMPSFVPPEPVTDVWLLPMMAMSEGLRWRRDSGWAVIDIWAAQI